MITITCTITIKETFEESLEDTFEETLEETFELSAILQSSSPISKKCRLPIDPALPARMLHYNNFCSFWISPNR